MQRYNAIASNSWEPPQPPADDSLLPEVMHSPRLRSVSSLVLSCDFEDGLPGMSRSRSRERRPREQQQQQQQQQQSQRTAAAAAAVDAAVDAAALNAGMNEIFNAMPLPPPTNIGREQSFPPPNAFPTQAGSPRLSRDPSFPPPVQPGLPMDIIQGSVSDWSGRHMAAPSTVSGGLALGGGDGGGLSRGGRVGVRVGGGGGRSSSEFSNNFGGEALVQQQSSSSLEHGQWEVGSGSSNGRPGGRGGCNSIDDDDSMFLDVASRPLHQQHARRPSFDKLAAMIPDIPVVRWPSPSSTSTSPSTSAAELMNTSSNNRPSSSTTSSTTTSFDVKPKSALVTPTLDPAQPTRGRPCTRPGRPRRSLEDDVHHLRGGGIGGLRQSKKQGGGKRGDAPLSCGPASLGGGPVDLARQARRTAKIQRYLYKRSRRKFANSTRDASPSRSRPKAARVRPREKGKFVKTVPDFIPVTAVAPETYVEVDTKHAGVRPRLGNGMGMGRGGGLAKREVVKPRSVAKLGPSSVAWRNALLQCPGGGGGAVVPPVHGAAATDGMGSFYCPPSPM